MTLQRQEDSVEETDVEQENRPLVHQDADTALTEPSNTPSSPPLLRNPSAVSRLGSRVLPDSVARALLSSGEETPAEGLALRNGPADRLRSAAQRQSDYDGATRFSLAGSIRRRIESRNDTRMDFRRHTIRGPFPLGATHQQISNEHEASLDMDRTPPGLYRESRVRRFRRFRNSLTSPFSSFLPGSQHRTSPFFAEGPSSNRPARVTFADDSDQLLPPLSSAEHRPELDNAPHELDAAEPDARHVLAPAITSGMSTIRRFNRLRSRSTRLMRPENPPLSQVLQLAAAAIAAQLSGHTAPTPHGPRALASEAFDDIQNFVQTLQDAANAQAGEPIDVNAAESDLPAVNFMRVFQFPNDERGSPITSQARSRDVNVTDLDQITSPTAHDRSVTLVLVGVRSMPHGHETATGEGGPLGGPSLDNLLSLPFLPPSDNLNTGAPSALFQRPDGGSRFRGRRRSMTNFSFPAQYETQRHHRPRAFSGLLSPDQPGTTAATTPLSESPPGPHPPPSTPADVRSGHATPIRRPSSASAVHGATLPGLDEDGVQSSVESTPDSGYNVARQRQRSDSEFARRPELGSGAARRNGVVEPDNPSAGSGRSWLIYVVGTNVSPDHPAFTMPSLFTDNPSYEDMQMLSALLGPVKPPVASADDVTLAGGLYRVVSGEYGLQAQASEVDASPALAFGVGERCLICLSDYEVKEEVRQLAKCQHTFHRECIDEVRASRQSYDIIANEDAVADHRSKQLSNVSWTRGCRDPE